MHVKKLNESPTSLTIVAQTFLWTVDENPIGWLKKNLNKKQGFADRLKMVQYSNTLWPEIGSAIAEGKKDLCFGFWLNCRSTFFYGTLCETVI